MSGRAKGEKKKSTFEDSSWLFSHCSKLPRKLDLFSRNGQFWSQISLLRRSPTQQQCVRLMKNRVHFRSEYLIAESRRRLEFVIDERAKKVFPRWKICYHPPTHSHHYQRERSVDLLRRSRSSLCKHSSVNSQRIKMEISQGNCSVGICRRAYLKSLRELFVKI